MSTRPGLVVVSTTICWTQDTLRPPSILIPFVFYSLYPTPTHRGRETMGLCVCCWLQKQQQQLQDTPAFAPAPSASPLTGQNRLYATISKRTSITCRIRRVVRRLDSDIWLTVVWWLGRQPLPWASYLPRLPLLQAPLSVRLFFCSLLLAVSYFVFF